MLRDGASSSVVRGQAEWGLLGKQRPGSRGWGEGRAPLMSLPMGLTLPSTEDLPRKGNGHLLATPRRRGTLCVAQTRLSLASAGICSRRHS